MGWSAPLVDTASPAMANSRQTGSGAATTTSTRAVRRAVAMAATAAQPRNVRRGQVNLKPCRILGQRPVQHGGEPGHVAHVDLARDADCDHTTGSAHLDGRIR